MDSREQAFSEFCNELNGLYEAKKNTIYNDHIHSFKNKYSFLKEISLLKVIEKHDYETYHSKILKYLWDSSTKFGSEALLSFLKEIGVEDKVLESISNKDYSLKDKKYVDYFKYYILLSHRDNSKSTKDQSLNHFYHLVQIVPCKRLLLNKKCLTNMRMQLEVIATTFNDLENVLDQYFDIFSNYIDENYSNLQLEIGSWKRGTMYFFGDEDDYKVKYIYDPKIFTQLKYDLPFEQNKKKDPLRIDIDYGYLCDETQNVIYFQLFDLTDTNKILTNEIKDEIVQVLPKVWDSGVDDNSIYIQFEIDEDLTTDKINNCAMDFKNYILKTVLYSQIPMH